MKTIKEEAEESKLSDRGSDTAYFSNDEQ